jgi:hypothetical protein
VFFDRIEAILEAIHASWPFTTLEVDFSELYPVVSDILVEPKNPSLFHVFS